MTILMQSNSLPSLQVYKFCCHGIFLRHDSKVHNQINSIQSQVRWIGFSSRPVMAPDWTRQILTNCTVLVLYNTVFSFWTDNCPSWISGRERMVADTFSWPNLIKSHSFVEILLLRFGHENVSTTVPTVLSLPQIQEGQLSVTGERMGTNYW